MDRIDIKVVGASGAVVARVYKAIQASEAPVTITDLESQLGKARSTLQRVLKALQKDEWIVVRTNPFRPVRDAGSGGRWVYEYTVCGRQWPEGFWAPEEPATALGHAVPGRYIVLAENDNIPHEEELAAIKVHNAKNLLCADRGGYGCDAGGTVLVVLCEHLRLRTAVFG